MTIGRAEILTLINNIALLLIMSVAYEATNLLPSKHQRWVPWINGAVLSGICVVIMKLPFTLEPGLVYDTRSILISVTGLVFGWIPTIMTGIAAILVRISIGGIGTSTGIAVILSSAAIGLAWRYWVYPKTQKWRYFSAFLMGVSVHAAMLICTLLLPYPYNVTVIRTIALPVLTIYPAGSVLLSVLLIRQQEYKGVQDQLAQSKERFQSLFEKAPLGYQSLDINGNFLEVNQQWLDLLGYSREEVIGKWFGDFLAPEYRDIFRERFLIFQKQGRIHSEFEMIHKNGDPVFIAFDGRISYGENGGFLQTHCILKDISSEKKMEYDLRISEEKYRRLFETMALGVVYQTNEGKIISMNPAAERILGRTFEELKGHTSGSPIWKINKEDGTIATENDHPSMIALKTGKLCGPVVFGVFNPKISDYVWISIIAIPLFHSGETVPYQVYTTFQDISAEHRANRDYYLLFQEMVDAFALHEIICDKNGKPINYRFLAVNSAFEKMTGLVAPNIIGKTVLEILPKTEAYWIETYGRVALTGEPIQFENYSSETDKYFVVSAYSPAPKQFACTFSDVTNRLRAEREANWIMSRLKGLLENSPTPIMIIDEKGNLIDASSSAEHMLARSSLNGDGGSIRRVPPIILQKISRMLQRQDDSMILCDLDTFEDAKEKKYYDSRLFSIPVPSREERLFGYIAVDVTERIFAEHALRESEEKYSTYINSAPFGIFVVNENGEYIDVNPAASRISGYSRAQLLHMSILEITANESVESAAQSFSVLKETGSLNTELQFIRADGAQRWWTVTATKLSGGRYLGFSTDITDRKSAEEELIFLSNHDFLTGLYNRRYFEAEIKRADTEQNLPLSIIMGDINGVKLINDAFGHTEGDRLIAESAQIIKDCCRENDTLARIGGDEFGIIMPNTESASALKILAQIQSAIKSFDSLSKNDHFQHGVSLGFGTKKNPEEEILQIIKIAEEYMYQRKLLEHTSSHSAIISSIKATMFEKSHETEEHAERLVTLSKLIADGLNLPQKDQDRLELLATLHDIGKVGISDRILSKPGKLTEEEWVEMKRHPEIGYRIAMSSPELIPVAEGILCHQEHWDGTGYPQKLSGENIPLLSRIIAVVDAYDAMTQDRPYRSAMSHEAAVQEIERNAGSQFDPKIAQVFIQQIRNSMQL
ncbi:MAG: PAS domain S-box protein [Eubacteriales bacterium]|nr:PAS domain S-box protein [Eubacteriales bacterium]